jgi:hypothetical protein
LSDFVLREGLAVGCALLILAGLTYLLSRSRVQQSQRYQAMVVPMANIMDVGFLVLAPAIVLLAGYAAPLVMLGICLLAMATGFAISYNIRHQEPLEGTSDPVNKVDTVSRWALYAASVVNIAYYTLLLFTLALWPLGFYTETRLAVLGVVFLALLLAVGWFGGLQWLNKLGYRTTAFNLAAVVAVVSAIVIWNGLVALAGEWTLPERPFSMDGNDFRKVLGLFAIVQGFEAARYIGSRFSADLRISGMRAAQYISTVVFVVLLASSIFLFANTETEFDGTAIFKVSDVVGDLLPWLILLAALGSQLSAIVNATMSRSDMLVSLRVPRRFTFVLLVAPAVVIFIMADIAQAVSLASRVFAAYFLLQALIAGVLAWRKRSWAAVTAFVAIGAAMATIAVFSLPL